MTAPNPIDRQTFLAHLRQSGLVPAARLAALADQFPAARARPLARALVEQGVITKWQAERLLVGRTGGFHLGQYTILEQIGRGGMGRVYKAEHRTMSRVVALKVLAPDITQNERARELFLREVQAVGRLVHPNIVTAFDANEKDGRYYLVLEFVDGPNLEQLVRAQGPLAVGLACDYVKQVAHGLHAAHALGMVHRDIKPANVLVQRRGLTADQPGLVKVSDFGLARLHSPAAATPPGQLGTILTKDNTVMGTPDYLSPEQSRSLHKTDIRSDIYSLGCTFFFLLTGRVPYAGGTSLEKLIRHATEPLPPVNELRPEVPAAVAAVLHKMVAKRPEERYQTPLELAAALESFAVGGPMPWAPRSGLVPALDPLKTPTGLGDSDGEMIFSMSEVMSSTANTVERDGSLSPTPLGGPIGTPAARPGAAGGGWSRLLWLWVALGVLLLFLGLVGVAAAAALLMWLRPWA